MIILLELPMAHRYNNCKTMLNDLTAGQMVMTAWSFPDILSIRLTSFSSIFAGSKWLVTSIHFEWDWKQLFLE